MKKMLLLAVVATMVISMSAKEPQRGRESGCDKAKVEMRERPSACPQHPCCQLDKKDKRMKGGKKEMLRKQQDKRIPPQQGKQLRPLK